MNAITDLPRPISAKQAAWLQLAPGIASLPVFAVLAWLLAERQIPNIFALVLSVVLVEVPLCWIIMVRHTRREFGQFSIKAALPWLKAVPLWLYGLIGVPLVLFSMFMIVGIGPRFEAILQPGLFGWVPDWFVMRPDPAMFSELSRGMLMTLWVLMFFGMVIAGGITQEVYSRGFLLPRTQHMGRWAPAYNALLFAMLHTVAPWAWPAFFLMILPWSYLVWWRRSVKIGLFIHVGMLALQWLGMTLVIFGLVEVPA